MTVTIEEMAEQIDFEFFLERESIPFKKGRGVSGMQFNIRTCPEPSCQDNRYRTYMGEETGRGNCFVCGTGFNKLSFIHKYLDATSWRDTFKFVEDMLREQGWRPKRKAMAALDQGAVELPTSMPLPLPDGSNLLYLEQRGFDGDIARYFDLRLCEFGWWKFKNEEGKVQTQDFSNRIIIPVYDLDGTLRTFQGRDLSGTSDRKYLFPKELPGTGRYLFNGQNVMATKSVVMGEGVFDVAALKVAFDQDPQMRDIVPIGSFGKHLSYGSNDGNDQLGAFNKLKARGLRFVTIMWDGEPKALTAAMNAAKLLTGLGLIVKVATLPFDKDPNEVLPEVVRETYRNAQTYNAALDVRWRLRNPYAGK